MKWKTLTPEIISKPLEIGTRIIYQESQGEILQTNISSWKEHDNRRLWRYKIRLFDRFTLQNEMVETWVSELEVKIDLQYYREEKLNQLLD